MKFQSLTEIYAGLRVGGSASFGKTTAPSEAVDVLGNIAVSGTVDGVDVSLLKSDFDSHTHTIGGLSDVTITSPTDNQVLIYSAGTWVNQNQSGAGSGINTSEPITQTAHGFVVGDVLRHNGTSYVKSNASTSSDAEAVGIVSEVTDVDNFILLYDGRVSGLSALTAGEVYFLQDNGTLGLNPGTINKPLLVSTSTTSGIFVNYRGAESGTIDADTLDGLDSTQFLRSDVSDSFTGNSLTLTQGSLGISKPSNTSSITFYPPAGGGEQAKLTHFTSGTGNENSNVFFSIAATETATVNDSFQIGTTSSGGSLDEVFELDALGNATFMGNIQITEASAGRLSVGTSVTSGMVNIWGPGTGEENIRLMTSSTAGQNYLSFWDSDPTDAYLGYFGFPYANGTFSLGTRRNNYVEILANNRQVVTVNPSGDLRLYGPAADNTNIAFNTFYRSNGVRVGYVGEIGDAGNLHLNAELGALKLSSATDVQFNGNAMWHAGNDGTGSGLDADLLDGQDSTAFASAEDPIVMAIALG